jgi:hypothetical protein
MREVFTADFADDADFFSAQIGAGGAGFGLLSSSGRESAHYSGGGEV